MPHVDTTQVQWQDRNDGEKITGALWNARKDDLVTLLNGGLDEDNVSTGGLHPDNVDGNSVTLEDGSKSGNSGEQTITRDTKTTGDWDTAGEWARSASTSDGTDTTPAVNDTNVLYVNNTSGSSTTITRFDHPSGLVDGQELTVYLFGADDVTIDTHTGGIGSVSEGEIILDSSGGSITINYSAASHDYTMLKLRATDLDGTANAVFWAIEDTETAAT